MQAYKSFQECVFASCIALHYESKLFNFWIYVGVFLITLFKIAANLGRGMIFSYFIKPLVNINILFCMCTWILYPAEPTGYKMMRDIFV